MQGGWTAFAVPTGTLSRDFHVSIYADAGGIPNDLPLANFNTTASLSNPQPFALNPQLTVYDASFTFPQSVFLSAGANYWFSAVDAGAIQTGSDGFFWASSSQGNKTVAVKDNSGWHAATENLGFSLMGNVVPEPSAIALAAIATLGLLGTTRRGAKHAASALTKSAPDCRFP